MQAAHASNVRQTTLATTTQTPSDLPYPIGSTEAAHIFLTVWPYRWLASKPALRLDLPSLSLQSQHTAEKRLNFWRNVCGCQFGAFVFLGACVWRARVIINSSQWSWRSIAFNAALTLAMAVIAKMIVLLTARLIFVADLRWLMVRANRASPEKESA